MGAATFARAVDTPGDELLGQMDRWAAVSKDRHALLGPVCDLLLLRVTREAGRIVDISTQVPDLVHRAAVELFGHDVGKCADRCDICDQARVGDWPRALRLVVKDASDIIAASLTDAYRAARRGGLVPAVTKSLDPDAGLALDGAEAPTYRPGLTAPTPTDDEPPPWWGRKEWPL